MAQTFSQILQSINNSEIRIALEMIMALVGLQPGDSTGPSALTGDVTGNLTGNVTGDVAGDLTGNSAGTHTGAVVGDVTGDLTGIARQIKDGGTDPVNAVASSGKLTSSGAVVAAVHAVSVFTSAVADVADTKTVTIGATVYRFMTVPAQAYDVLRGTSTANSIANLAAAINASGTGDGTDYFAGTLAHPTVYCSASDATTLTVQVRIPGDEQNAAVTETTDVNWTWTGADFANGTIAGVTSAAATFTIGTRTYMVVNELSETNAVAIVDQVLRGVNEEAMLDNIILALTNGSGNGGTEYSSGTTVNADVTASANSPTVQAFVAKVKGVVGDSIALSTTLANTVADGATLGTLVAGVDGTVGLKGETRFNTSYLYLCTADNTIADANWYTAPLTIVS